MKFKNERDYEEVVEALVPLFTAMRDPYLNVGPKLIAIDGRTGVGKSGMGRFLSWTFNATLIETDLYMIPGRGRPIYRLEDLRRVIDYRLITAKCPVFVEGIMVVKLLELAGLQPDFLIHISCPQHSMGPSRTRDEIEDYEVTYAPTSTADLVITFDDNL